MGWYCTSELRMSDGGLIEIWLSNTNDVANAIELDKNTTG